MERAGREGYYRLERYDRTFGDDATPEGRTLLRLHGPGRTTGCIEVCKLDEFSKVDSMLKHTAKRTAEVESKSLFGDATETLVNFGSMYVLPSGVRLSYNTNTGVVSLTFAPTGSRIQRTATVCTVQKDNKTGQSTCR